MLGKFIVRKFVLSSSPSFTSDYVVMIHSWGKFAFWRPGDHEWTIVDDALGRPYHIYSDLTYHKGQFYAVNASGNVFVCEMEEPKKAKMKLVVPSSIPCSSWKAIPGGISMNHIGRFTFFSKKPLGLGFLRCNLVMGNGRISEVKNLGNKSLFLCYNSSFSVEASDYSGCKSSDYAQWSSKA